MRKGLWAFLLCLWSIPAAAAGISNPDQAVAAVEEAFLPQGRAMVVLEVWGPVDAGIQVSSVKAPVFVTPREGYVVYIDDHPTANLHDGRYAFVSLDGRTLEVHEAPGFPANPADYRRMDTDIGAILAAATNRRAEPKPGPKAAPDASRWAVLMNGGHSSGANHVRYWNDLSNIYMTLVDVYGFADERIIVLCSDGLDPAPDQSNGQNSDPDLDGDGDDDIMFPADLASLDAVFAGLATHLTIEDKLFVFTTDHGDTRGGYNTIFNLWNGGELTDAHFADLLDALPQCEIINTFEPCFSGGFLDDVVVPPGPRVASSACRHDEYSWAMPPDYVYDTYVFHWTAAIKGEDAYGVPVDADANSDGVVSMSEAFDYAEYMDQSDEEPQYADFPVGVGSGLTLWRTGSDPFLVVAGSDVDDIGGNDNGAADPGETVSMVVTLGNVGGALATGISGALSTTDPYALITQDYATFPDLDQFQQGEGAPAYVIDVAANCPIGHLIDCELGVVADGGYTTTGHVNFMVGNPVLEPCGPDDYGYWAYDVVDRPGAHFEWLEIAPMAGGPGVANGPSADDTPVTLSLPFSFQYYGQSYSQVTVSPNGWVAMGSTTDTDYTPSPIPDPDGPAAMIAAFWTDLNPTYGGSQVCTYHDVELNVFVVEWYRISHYGAEETRETFEIVLYDPAHHWSPTGDGDIVVLHDLVSSTGAAGFGVENANETIGLEYGLGGQYDLHADPIGVRSAVLYSTQAITDEMMLTVTPQGAPIVVPAGGGPVSYEVEVRNNSGNLQRIDIWSDVLLPTGGRYGPIDMVPNLRLRSGAGGDALVEQDVPGGAPAGSYEFEVYLGNYPHAVWISEGFAFEKE